MDRNYPLRYRLSAADPLWLCCALAVLSLCVLLS